MVVLLPCWSPVLCWSVLEDRLWEPVLPSRPVRSRSSERARILSTLEREVNVKTVSEIFKQSLNDTRVNVKSLTTLL